MIDINFGGNGNDKQYISTTSNKIEINNEYFEKMNFFMKNNSNNTKSYDDFIDDFIKSLEHKTHVKILKCIKDDPNPLTAYDLCPIGDFDNQDVYFFDLYLDYGEHILTPNGDINNRKKTFVASIGINLRNTVKYNIQSEHNWFYNENSYDYDNVLSEAIERVNTLKYLDAICNFCKFINELDKDQSAQKIIELRKKFISNNDYVSMDHLMYCLEI